MVLSSARALMMATVSPAGRWPPTGGAPLVMGVSRGLRGILGDWGVGLAFRDMRLTFLPSPSPFLLGRGIRTRGEYGGHPHAPGRGGPLHSLGEGTIVGDGERGWPGLDCGRYVEQVGASRRISCLRRWEPRARLWANGD